MKEDRMTYPVIDDACAHDFVQFAMVSEFLYPEPNRVIGTVKLCRKCYARPPAAPPIPVSEAVIQAGYAAWIRLHGTHGPGIKNPETLSIRERITPVYQAMRRVELEEQAKPGAQEGAPYGAELYSRKALYFPLIVPNQRSGRDRRKDNGWDGTGPLGA